MQYLNQHLNNFPVKDYLLERTLKNGCNCLDYLVQTVDNINKSNLDSWINVVCFENAEEYMVDDYFPYVKLEYQDFCLQVHFLNDFLVDGKWELSIHKKLYDLGVTLNYYQTQCEMWTPLDNFLLDYLPKDLILIYTKLYPSYTPSIAYLRGKYNNREELCSALDYLDISGWDDERNEESCYYVDDAFKRDHFMFYVASAELMLYYFGNLDYFEMITSSGNIREIIYHTLFYCKRPELVEPYLHLALDNREFKNVMDNLLDTTPLDVQLEEELIFSKFVFMYLEKMNSY